MTKTRVQQLVSPLRERLAATRGRERILRLTFGVATAALFFIPALFMASAIDWIWDLEEGTPFPFRVICSLGLASLLATLVLHYILRPLIHPLTEDTLAAWVEQGNPDFNHSLTTILQLTRTTARMEGQSPVLLDELIQTTVTLAEPKDFLNSLDTSRWKTSAKRALGPVLMVLLAFLFFGETTIVLLQRQCLLAVDIPRDAVITLPEKIVLPEGEEKALAFAVKMRSEKPVPAGKVFWISPAGEKLTLTANPSTDGFVETTIPFSLGQGNLRVRIGDTRAGPIPLIRMARPILELLETRVRRPEWYGKRPDGSVFEETSPKGDVAGMIGGTVSLKLKSSQPLSVAVVTVKPLDPAGIPRTHPCKLSPDGLGCDVEFPLQEGDYRYQIRVANKEGLENFPHLQRRITVFPAEPPVVMLMPEQLPGTKRAGSTLEDSDIDGLPVLLGQKFRVVYQAESMGGIARAQFRFRINEKGPWRALPLQEFKADLKQSGAFLPEEGAFVKSPPDSNIDFYPIPSPDPWKIPDRRQAGGRFDFQIGSIKELRIGDRIEFYVEATDIRPGEGLTGQSEIRVKEVVGVEELLAWWRRKERETEKLTELKNRQGQVFDGFTPEMRKTP